MYHVQGQIFGHYACSVARTCMDDYENSNCCAEFFPCSTSATGLLDL